jgi:hypothetical protein
MWNVRVAIDRIQKHSEVYLMSQREFDGTMKSDRVSRQFETINVIIDDVDECWPKTRTRSDRRSSDEEDKSFASLQS